MDRQQDPRVVPEGEPRAGNSTPATTTNVETAKENAVAPSKTTPASSDEGPADGLAIRTTTLSVPQNVAIADEGVAGAFDKQATPSESMGSRTAVVEPNAMEGIEITTPGGAVPADESAKGAATGVADAVEDVNDAMEGIEATQAVAQPASNAAEDAVTQPATSDRIVVCMEQPGNAEQQEAVDQPVASVSREVEEDPGLVGIRDWAVSLMGWADGNDEDLDKSLAFEVGGTTDAAEATVLDRPGVPPEDEDGDVDMDQNRLRSPAVNDAQNQSEVIEISSGDSDSSSEATDLDVDIPGPTQPSLVASDVQTALAMFPSTTTPSFDVDFGDISPPNNLKIYVALKKMSPAKRLLLQKIKIVVRNYRRADLYGLARFVALFCAGGPLYRGVNLRSANCGVEPRKLPMLLRSLIEYIDRDPFSDDSPGDDLSDDDDLDEEVEGAAVYSEDDAEADEPQFALDNASQFNEKSWRKVLKKTSLEIQYEVLGVQRRERILTLGLLNGLQYLGERLGACGVRYDDFKRVHHATDWWYVEGKGQSAEYRDFKRQLLESTVEL